MDRKLDKREPDDHDARDGRDPYTIAFCDASDEH